MPALPLPQITLAATRLANCVCTHQRKFVWDNNLSVELLPVPIAFESVFSIYCRIDNHIVTCELDELSLATIVNDKHAFTCLPLQLQIACIEHALDSGMFTLTQHLQSEIQVENFSLEKKTADTRPCLCFRLQSESLYSYGRLCMETKAIAWLTENISRLPSRYNYACNTLPVTIGVYVARTYCTVAQLQAISSNDIVLFDECYSPDKQQVQVRAPGNLYFRGSINSQCCITLSQQLEPPMNTEQHFDQSPQASEPAGDIDVSTLPVTLDFQLAEHTIELQTLQQLCAGYTFDLGLDLTAPVTMTANGKAIAICELVDIENRLGARIVRILDNPETP